MHIYKNLIVIGTSHISQHSINEVKTTISEKKPEIIALEMDPLRLAALLNPKKQKKLPIKEIGFKGFLFSLIGSYLQKKLGKIVNVSPGSEMKTAFELAKQNKIKVALIDQDIRITLKKLSARITTKEKFQFLKDLILAPFSKEKIKIDLTKIPCKSIIKKAITKLKKDYPSVYITLIKERNQIMAKNLNKLMEDYNLILAVVGAGHEEDIIKELKNVY